MSFEDWQQSRGLEEAQRPAFLASHACHDRLVKEGINLAAYTSAANAADVNDLRMALGYAQWNIYGISYGTRLALTVMRDFPQGVRSVILDSVYPPQVDLYAEQAGNADRALNLLFERCAADNQCNAAYPELETVFYETTAQLDAHPLTLKLTHPITAQSHQWMLNGNGLISTIFLLLYNTEALPYVPRIIYELHEGRTSGIGQFLSILPDAFWSEGMNFSVQCGEEATFSSPEIVAAANAAVSPPFNKIFDQRLFFTECASWGAKPAAAIENEPVVSDIPTLILAGDNDPITTPAWGQLAAKTLSRSYYREFRWVGHGVYGAGMWRSCSRNIVRDFLADPLSEPDSACLDDLRVYFVTD